jgi:hypothetical protein
MTELGTIIDLTYLTIYSSNDGSNSMTTKHIGYIITIEFHDSSTIFFEVKQWENFPLQFII